MRISVFLSHPQPFNSSQESFIKLVSEHLENRGLKARTLGVTDYDMDAPLTAIRRLMLEANGLITIAFRRAFIEKGIGKPNTNLPGSKSYPLEGTWLTSPYCHIEPAMAFQIGLPILIFREKGVIADGILEKGVTGTYLPEFDLDDGVENYFQKPEWKQLIDKWESYVRRVVDTKGSPPRLY